MLLLLQVDDADVRDGALVLLVNLEGLLVLRDGLVVLLLVEEGLSLELDCLRFLPVLDHGEVSRQSLDVTRAQMSAKHQVQTPTSRFDQRLTRQRDFCMLNP